MANNLPELFRYHPASSLGSLLAGSPGLAAARTDAEPLVETPSLWVRLRSRVRRPVYQPLASS
jgi:hypothetical protein